MTAPAQVRAVGYVRVSSEDQAREGVSLAAQAERIAAYAAAKGWALVDVVRDEGLSAKDLNRTGLQNLLDALPRRQHDFEAVVVTKLDRLTRSVRDLGTLMDAFKRAKVAFVSIGEDVNTGSAAGELFFNLVASVSQWERRAIGERTVAAMAHLRAGYRDGPPLPERHAWQLTWLQKVVSWDRRREKEGLLKGDGWVRRGCGQVLETDQSRTSDQGLPKHVARL